MITYQLTVIIETPDYIHKPELEVFVKETLINGTCSKPYERLTIHDVEAAIIKPHPPTPIQWEPLERADGE